MKKCCRCKIEKEENGFSKGQKVCKQCYREYYLKKTQRKCLECNSLCPQQRHVYCSNECKIIHNTEKCESGCWEWKGSVLKCGYGNTRDCNEKGKVLKVHRLSYETFKGKITDRLLVLHVCDNRKCCNPKHLYLGTHHDNNMDCLVRGRWKGGSLPGEGNGRSKLKDEQVKEIKKELREGVRPYVLAKRFGVKNITIYHIRDGRSWKHIEPG